MRRALTVDLLVAGLTGCACSSHLALTGLGAVGTVVLGDPSLMVGEGIEAGGCLAYEAHKANEVRK